VRGRRRRFGRRGFEFAFGFFRCFFSFDFSFELLFFLFFSPAFFSFSRDPGFPFDRVWRSRGFSRRPAAASTNRGRYGDTQRNKKRPFGANLLELRRHDAYPIPALSVLKSLR